jgi:hypothetical protein
MVVRVHFASIPSKDEDDVSAHAQLFGMFDLFSLPMMDFVRERIIDFVSPPLFPLFYFLPQHLDWQARVGVVCHCVQDHCCTCLHASECELCA